MCIIHLEFEPDWLNELRKKCKIFALELRRSRLLDAATISSLTRAWLRRRTITSSFMKRLTIELVEDVVDRDAYAKLAVMRTAKYSVKMAVRNTRSRWWVAH